MSDVPAGGHDVEHVAPLERHAEVALGPTWLAAGDRGLQVAGHGWRLPASEAAASTGAELHTVSSAGPTNSPPTRGTVAYTYRDGDDARTVWLVQAPGRQARGLGNVPQAGADSNLVFVTESGSTMTLTGGVVLLLDTEWSAAQVDEFFAHNRINRAQVSELGWIDNGFAISAGAGLAPLELANVLAYQQGVVLSSPDWALEPALQ